MPFPAINYCLVCEGARPEVGGKLTVLGFFGVTPNVEIGVARLDQPMVLMVILGFGIVEDANQVYNHSFVILNPDGSALAKSVQPSPINVVAGRPGLIGFSATAIPNVAGLRTVRLIINQQTHFEDKFLIRKARPEELGGMLGARLQ